MDMVRRVVPDMSLATDWIVGFPGETDEDFDQSVQLLRDVSFQSSFVFKYSVRSGTKAAKAMEDDVPKEVKEHRNHVLLAEQETISRRLHAARKGEVHRVLVDGVSKKDATKQSGRTSQNWIVVFEAGRDLTGRFVDVRITDSTPLTLFGELV